MNKRTNGEKQREKGGREGEGGTHGNNLSPVSIEIQSLSTCEGGEKGGRLQSRQWAGVKENQNRRLITATLIQR